MIAESLGEDVRGEGCHKAEQIGDGDAEADQGEHVEVHGPDRLQRAGEEGPAAPKHHRSGQQKLQPLRGSGFDELIERPRRDHVAHRVGKERQREECAPPEPSPHVDEFRIGAFIETHRFGFERHSADRAGARAWLAYFRMHRAGIDCAFWNIFDRIEVRVRKVELRIGPKFVKAARGAEIMM